MPITPFVRRRRPGSEFANPDQTNPLTPVEHSRPYIDPMTPDPNSLSLYSRNPSSHYDRFRQVEHYFDFFRPIWQQRRMRQDPFIASRQPINAGGAARPTLQGKMDNNISFNRRRSLARRAPMNPPQER